jgi:hypothetical protein
MPLANKDLFIEKLVSGHVTEYLFPGGTMHTPDFVSMTRADKMTWMLRNRLTELRAQGVDVSALSVKELLGKRPDDIELTDEDFLASM